ncbi:MAG: 50S ribosomal protein L10 [Phycisphaerales bacterium]|nr:50S ribosomal protein L10 [Phycisphaerales bacterium]
MSKPVKEMIVAEYKRRFENIDDAVLVSIRGIPANDNNRLRLGLAEKEIRIAVIRNALAKQAMEGTSLEGLTAALDGPSALAYGAGSVVTVARELTTWAKEVQLLELKGAVLDGTQFMGPKEVDRLSKFPTREEALAENITLIMSPGAKLLSQITGPGGKVMAVVKSIEEKLEEGETISKIA